jgi:protein-tyrosine phosphatase
MDLDQILPQLLAGDCPRTTSDVDALKYEYGITGILCLQTEDELVRARIESSRLEAHCRESGMEIRRVPVHDNDPESLRRSLPECVSALDSLLRDGHKVYVHCGLGTSRAPTAIIAYLHWVQEWDFEEAVDYVTACRLCTPEVKVLKLANEDYRALSARVNPAAA